MSRRRYRRGNTDDRAEEVEEYKNVSRAAGQETEEVDTDDEADDDEDNDDDADDDDDEADDDEDNDDKADDEAEDEAEEDGNAADDESKCELARTKAMISEA